MVFFLFFKQKTAYEMRISDWSSDVCSSDLSLRSISRQERPTCAEHQSQRLPSRPQPPSERIVQSLVTTLVSFGQSLAKMRLPLAIGVRMSRMLLRSEEHTSELQSLMRISYAVFCLKKKKEKKYERQTLMHITSRNYCMH